MENLSLLNISQSIIVAISGLGTIAGDGPLLSSDISRFSILSDSVAIPELGTSSGIGSFSGETTEEVRRMKDIYIYSFTKHNKHIFIITTYTKYDI
jgi:hypothetical protein